MADRSVRVREWHPGILSRFGIACLTCIALAVMMSGAAYADCIDTYNGQTYCGHTGGCGVDNGYFWAQVATQSAPCATGFGGIVNCHLVYNTLGGEGNISANGGSQVWSASDHALAWLSSYEDPNHCTFSVGCWVQVGWQLGHHGTPNNCGGTTNSSTIQVEVEIFDDSSAPCFNQTFGAPPSNASYDARYDSTLPNGLHRYQVYYEAPGSGNIQNLAYADFKSQTTAEVAAIEAQPWTVTSGVVPNCPIVSKIPSGQYVVFGQPARYPSFADYMSLYTGSWQHWTTAIQPTRGYIWPEDIGGPNNPSNPYLITPVSNWSAGDYTGWKAGGPHA